MNKAAWSHSDLDKDSKSDTRQWWLPCLLFFLHTTKELQLFLHVWRRLQSASFGLGPVLGQRDKAEHNNLYAQGAHTLVNRSFK